MPIPDDVLPVEPDPKSELIKQALLRVDQWLLARRRVSLTLAAMTELCPFRRADVLDELEDLWARDEEKT